MTCTHKRTREQYACIFFFIVGWLIRVLCCVEHLQLKFVEFHVVVAIIGSGSVYTIFDYGGVRRCFLGHAIFRSSLSLSHTLTVSLSIAFH